MNYVCRCGFKVKKLKIDDEFACKWNFKCPNKIVASFKLFISDFCNRKQKIKVTQINNSKIRLNSAQNLPGWTKAFRPPKEETTRMMKEAIGGVSLVKPDISGYNLMYKLRFFSITNRLQFHKTKKKKIEVINHKKNDIYWHSFQESWNKRVFYQKRFTITELLVAFLRKNREYIMNFGERKKERKKNTSSISRSWKDQIYDKYTKPNCRYAIERGVTWYQHDKRYRWSS